MTIKRGIADEIQDIGFALADFASRNLPSVTWTIHNGGDLENVLLGEVPTHFVREEDSAAAVREWAGYLGVTPEWVKHETAPGGLYVARALYMDAAVEIAAPLLNRPPA